MRSQQREDREDQCPRAGQALPHSAALTVVSSRKPFRKTSTDLTQTTSENKRRRNVPSLLFGTGTTPVWKPEEGVLERRSPHLSPLRATTQTSGTKHWGMEISKTRRKNTHHQDGCIPGRD